MGGENRKDGALHTTIDGKVRKKPVRPSKNAETIFDGHLFLSGQDKYGYSKHTKPTKIAESSTSGCFGVMGSFLRSGKKRTGTTSSTPNVQPAAKPGEKPVAEKKPLTPADEAFILETGGNSYSGGPQAAAETLATPKKGAFKK